MKRGSAAFALGVLALAALCSVLSSGAATAQPTEQQLSALQNSRIEVKYEPPESERFKPMMERLQQRRVLEDLKAFLAPLRLSHKLVLSTKQCDAINAYYSRSDGLILCYEYIEHIEKLAPKDTTPEGFTRQEGIAGAFAEVALHETGHAVFHIFEAPVFGREEDAADQLAGFVMLQFSRDLARLAIKGAAYSYLSQEKEWAGTAFADEHGTHRQRYYNYLCLAYGGDPTEFQDFIDKGLLPKERAPNCKREYEQIRRAFAKTVLPFVDQDKVKVVQGIKWFRPDDGK
jgi:Putative metallopeptidase